jgi:hypothetical protein
MDIPSSGDLMIAYSSEELKELFARLKGEMMCAISANDVPSVQSYLICLATIDTALNKITADKKEGILND